MAEELESGRQVVVWGARGGHGATTIAAALGVFWQTTVLGREPWVHEWILGEPLDDGNRRQPILDAGILHRGVDRGRLNVVVLRGPCLIGLRTLRQHGEAIDCLVLVREPWRTTSNEWVASVLGADGLVEVAFSERVARLSDAGLLGVRIHSLDEFDGLRRWAKARSGYSSALPAASIAALRRRQPH